MILKGYFDLSRLSPNKKKPTGFLVFSGLLLKSTENREAPVRFGSVTVWGWNGSSGSGVRFWRFLCKKGFFFLCFSRVEHERTVPGSGFGSWKTVLAVPVPLSVSGKTVPTVPVSGSGSVPEPPCERGSVGVAGELPGQSLFEKFKGGQGSVQFGFGSCVKCRGTCISCDLYLYALAIAPLACAPAFALVADPWGC